MSSTKKTAPKKALITKRPPRGAAIVHYTDHTCRAADTTLGDPSWVKIPDENAHRGFEYRGRVDTVYGYKAYPTRLMNRDGTRGREYMVGGKDDRYIRWGGCRIHREKRDAQSHPVDTERHRFTTNRALVNCGRCLERLARTDAEDAERPGRGYMLASDALRQLDAWYLCCRDRGYARPAVDIGKARADLEVEKRQRLALVIDDMVSEARGLVAAVAMGATPNFDAFIAKLAAKLPAAVFAELGPALHETQFAAEVAREAALVMERGVAAGSVARARMIDGSIALSKDDWGTMEPDPLDRSGRERMLSAAVRFVAEPGTTA